MWKVKIQSHGVDLKTLFFVFILPTELDDTFGTYRYLPYF